MGAQCPLGPGLWPPETTPSGQVRSNLAKGQGLDSELHPSLCPCLTRASGTHGPFILFLWAFRGCQARPEGRRRCPPAAPVPALSLACSSCSPQLWRIDLISFSSQLLLGTPEPPGHSQLGRPTLSAQLKATKLQPRQDQYDHVPGPSEDAFALRRGQKGPWIYKYIII